jgi:hypothetical protein
VIPDLAVCVFSLCGRFPFEKDNLLVLSHLLVMMKTVILLLVFSVLASCTPPQVTSTQYDVKQANLLNSDVTVAVVEVETDQDLYFLDSVVCPPYSCVDEDMGCVCDFTHDGCSSINNNPPCCAPQYEEMCDYIYPWVDMQKGTFEYSIDNGFISLRYFHNEKCKAVRVSHVVFDVVVVVCFLLLFLFAIFLF